LNGFQALAQELSVSVPDLDVVLRSGSGFKSDGLADYERHSFGFGFAYLLGGESAAFSAMQHLEPYVVDNINVIMWRRDLCGVRLGTHIKDGSITADQRHIIVE